MLLQMRLSKLAQDGVRVCVGAALELLQVQQGLWKRNTTTSMMPCLHIHLISWLASQAHCGDNAEPQL